MSIYEILPALDLTQSVHAKIPIGMHRGVKFKISRIPLIGLETRLGGRTDRKFLQNPNLNEIIHKAQQHLIWFVNLILSFRKPFLSFYIYLLLIWLFRFIFIFLCCFLTTERVYCKIREIATFLEALEFRLIWLVKIVWMAKEEMST